MESFRPLSGNLLSLPKKHESIKYRGISFRPLSGNLLSLPGFVCEFTHNDSAVFVPYRGIYFLYKITIHPLAPVGAEFSSPIGESTFSTESISESLLLPIVFVPYRGIYFLYRRKRSSGSLAQVFVPYRGIYFLYPCL